MKSCVYKGRVKHQRFMPRLHEFTYSLFMMYVDLDELPDLFTTSRYWSVNKANIAAFHRKDHYGNKQNKLSDSVRELVQDKTGVRPTGPIRLLTHFRYFGHIFNPLSLYFCYDEAGEDLEVVVAEVMNTPWKEMHCYVLTDNHNEPHCFSNTHPKEFHVSPFMQLDMQYRWKIKAPGQSLHVEIENWQDDAKVFDAVLDLKKIEINSKNLKNVLLNFPLMTLKVAVAIHYEALRLWLKGIVYVPHPKNNRT